MKFYEGKKIEVHTKCEHDSCGKDIVWYKLFPQPMNSASYTAHIIAVDENVSSARVDIIEEREDEIDVKVFYRCRFCDETQEVTGKILKENNMLIFK
jgi:hypothetical protein